MRVRTSGEGYEYVIEERGATPAYIHRLCAIAEHGFDAVTSEHDVHHKAVWEGHSIPWINGRDLVEPRDWYEHRMEHLGNDEPAETASD